jgi:hypothetical protein
LLELGFVNDGTSVDLTVIEQQLGGVADSLGGPDGDDDQQAEVGKSEHRRPVDPPLAGRQEAPEHYRVQQ